MLVAPVASACNATASGSTTMWEPATVWRPWTATPASTLAFVDRWCALTIPTLCPVLLWRPLTTTPVSMLALVDRCCVFTIPVLGPTLFCRIASHDVTSVTSATWEYGSVRIPCVGVSRNNERPVSRASGKEVSATLLNVGCSIGAPVPGMDRGNGVMPSGCVRTDCGVVVLGVRLMLASRFAATASTTPREDTDAELVGR